MGLDLEHQTTNFAHRNFVHTAFKLNEGVDVCAIGQLSFYLMQA
jgi:exonuclease VII large subunit